MAGGPASIGSARWHLTHDGAGRAVEFVGAAGLVGTGDRAVGLAKVAGAWRAVAVRTATGAVLWESPAGAPYLDSWAAPALDAEHRTAIFAAGASLTAFDLANGAVRWSTPLERKTVNSSPAVTRDLGEADRVFVSDYDGYGDEGRLYGVNVDAWDGVSNPFAPGEIVWSAWIGQASGATPAYANGVVYVASAGDGAGSGGLIFAFDARGGGGGGGEAEPLWVFENPTGHGFFGGVAVRGGYVYAASYAFSGGMMAANLVKVRASDGSLVWSQPCNRTATVPVVLADGRIVVSAGIPGFGTAPSVQVFRDLGASAALEWDSAAETWVDGDHDGRMDAGEFLSVGGWNQQPALVRRAGRLQLFVGRMPTGGDSEGAVSLLRLDLGKRPRDAGFVAEEFQGCGSSPAVIGGRLVTNGRDGLFGF